MAKEINWLATATFIVFGAVFLYSAINIGPSFSGGNGHKTLPVALSSTVLALSVLVLVREIFWKSPEADPNQPIAVSSLFVRVLPLIALMILNGLGQIWFGYLVSTIVIGVLVFLLFGNSIYRALLHGIIGAVVLYFLFFRVMGLYEPPGSILEINLPF